MQSHMLPESTVGIHFEYSEYHVSQQNDQNLAVANMTMSDGVSPSLKGGGDGSGSTYSKSVTDDRVKLKWKRTTRR